MCALSGLLQRRIFLLSFGRVALMEALRRENAWGMNEV
jgi:hypothetical protein